MIDTKKIRNIAIIAHVDHGKTTLVDQMLFQSGTLGDRAALPKRVMDSNELEKERGITILSKNTAIRWQDYWINIVDTPGHADFGGEVERVLSMVDSVLLLVDAVEGPMPQTRFVTEKALKHGFRPIIVINKIDRDQARSEWVIDQTFDLFDRLGANEEQLDFPIIYASAIKGYACLQNDCVEGDLTPLFNTIIENVPSPNVKLEGAFQCQVSSLDYSSYMGLIGIGKVQRGCIDANTAVTVIDGEDKLRNGRMLQIFSFLGLQRVEVDQVCAGQIIAFTGLEELQISDTICAQGLAEALPPLTVDEPTVSMTFQVNTSPFAGKEGKYVTSRQIRERLMRECEHNVALRVEDTDDPDRFKVSGRGELHLSILIETMRREGYELGVSRPKVIMREHDGTLEEPFEQLTIDVENQHQGSAMEQVAQRGGDLQGIQPDGRGRVKLEYFIPARGLIGFRTDFLTATSGTGLIYHVFDQYRPVKEGQFGLRQNGVLISKGTGKVLAYALFNLQDRGRLFVSPGIEAYEGMLIGIHSRSNDLVVNPLKAKQLTNIRAAGTDENIVLTPPIRFSLEQALEFIDDDELVEVTPKSIRLRKMLLQEIERKRQKRQ